MVKTCVTSIIDDPFQRILLEDDFVTVLGDLVTKLFFYPFCFLSFILHKKNVCIHTCTDDFYVGYNILVIRKLCLSFIGTFQ